MGVQPMTANSVMAADVVSECVEKNKRTKPMSQISQAKTLLAKVSGGRISILRPSDPITKGTSPCGFSLNGFGASNRMVQRAPNKVIETSAKAAKPNNATDANFHHPDKLAPAGIIIPMAAFVQDGK